MYLFIRTRIQQFIIILNITNIFHLKIFGLEGNETLASYSNIAGYLKISFL